MTARAWLDDKRQTEDRGWSSLVRHLRPVVVCCPLSVVFLLALALRLFQLTYHSLWFDEAMSAYWASRPAAEIVRVGLGLTQDKHPPVYYLLLRAWTLTFGSDDAAVRSLGALMGALAVFPVYALASQWRGRVAGGLAALFLALNPFLVWYSQEARMFMPAAMLALVGLWGLTRAVDEGTWWAWAVFVAATLAGIYAYLFNALLLPVAGLWWLIGLTRAWRIGDRRRGRWLATAGGGSMMFTALGALPLLWRAWVVSGNESTPGRAFAGVGETLWRLGHAFWVHKAPLGAWGDLAVTTGTIVLVMGMAFTLSSAPLPPPQLGRGKKGMGGGARTELASALLVPWLLGNVLLARDASAFAEPRYWLFLVPFLCIAWGAGITSLWQHGRRPINLLAGSSLLAVLLAIQMVSLPWNWRPETRREDWRAAARYIETHAGPNDAVLVHVDYMRFPFLRYYRGQQPVYFPFSGPLDDPAQVAPPLEGMARFDTIWLVESHLEGVDNGRLVERWLSERYPLATEQFPAGIVVRAYAVRLFFDVLPPDAWLVSEEIAPGLTLAGCRLDEKVVAARDNVYHPPSGWVHVTLYWRRTGAVPAEARPRVRLVDELGQVWGLGLEREGSLWSMHPPTGWPLDGLIRDEHDINLNPLTPPGVYRVQIAVVGADDQPLGQEVSCGAVEITG
ncbi:MAG: glycosyltransferase family 39 protein [Anaerolineae bacterium]|nr:glycosyltransferase family 39 protein [Anaerolineae bacterium]MDW8100080.1 glycosyltransferase family 39 protein [Anaerolineae bacterium]